MSFYRTSYIVCECCGTKFVSQKPTGRLPRFCSPACKQKSYRRRLDDGQVQVFRNGDSRPETTEIVLKWVCVGESNRVGHPIIYIKCPFCQTTTGAFMWSLAGSGKKCWGCNAVHHWMGNKSVKRG